MGVVYKALDPAIGRTVAIKTIHLTDLTDSDERQRVVDRLLLEAQSAGTLSHPSIVTVYDVLRQDEFAYIVMEFVPGPSLDVMLREGRVPPRDALLVYLRQVAEALDYAHRKGVIHRDIKPANILISDPAIGVRSAKITDFGIAQTISHEGTHPGNLAGSLSGTPSYMSPEQIEGGAVDGRTDQFSLGVVVYELLCGRKPFAADSLPALLHMICTEQPKTADQVNPTLSVSVGKVLSRALAKKPEERFASASDLVGALAIALTDSPSTADVTRTATSAEMPLAATVAGVTRRQERPLDVSEDRPAGSSRKVAVISLLCFAVAAAVVFVVRLNSSAPTPIQVLVDHSAPLPAAAVTKPAQISRPKPLASPASSVEEPEAAKQRISHPRTSPARTEPVGVIVPATAPFQTTDDIDLVSEPAGAKIVVDDRPDATCNAPCTMALVTGRHTLTAELNGYAVAKRIFVLPGSSSLYIPMAQSTGILVLTSDPAGADISVDGRPYGQTPATLHLAPGVHRILLSHGLVRHEETLNIEADSFQTRGIRW